MKRRVLPFLLIAGFLGMAADTCQIAEVDQPATIAAGQTVNITVTVYEEQADVNAHWGVFAAMVPADWDLLSATYDASFGDGDFELFEDYVSWMAEIHAAPEGMKWIALRTDENYSHSGDQYYEVALEFETGTQAGEFELAYFVAKDAYQNAEELMSLEAFGSYAISTGHEILVTGGTSVGDEASLPVTIALEQNYPNPFNPSTAISFTLREASQVRLAVYDVRGREVAVIADRFFAAGDHVETFRAADLPSGTYVYRLDAGSHRVSRTMVLMK